MSISAKFILPAVALLFSQSQAIDEGFSVSCRTGGDTTYILRFDIKDNKRISEKIIYQKKEKKEARPRISFDGTKVAFYTGTHFCVMDADGQNVKQLVEIHEDIKWYDGRKGTSDWPSGDWIYYRKTDTEIYKVNAETGVEEKVITYSGSFRKWSINHALDRVAVQDGMCNMLHGLVSSYTLGQNCDPGGCNISISASGTYVNWFTGSGHNNVHTGSWDGTNPVEKISTVDNANSTTEKVTMEDMAGEFFGNGMDWPLWSSNSDKWECLQVGWPRPEGASCQGGRFCKCGSNQVLFNWVDSMVILTSSNPQAATGGRRNCAGDLWVKPPEGCTNHYEDINGHWVEVKTGTVGTRGKDATHANTRLYAETTSGPRARIYLPAGMPATIRIVDAYGRIVYSGIADGQKRFAVSAKLAAGVYLAQLRGRNAQAVCRFGITR
jgi:hypothetical protein